MAKRKDLELRIFSLLLCCLCFSIVSSTKNDKNQFLSSWYDTDGSWKKSHTTQDSLQRIRDLGDRLNRKTIAPPENIKYPKQNYRDRNDNLLDQNIDGSWKESYTTDNSLQHLRDLVDRLNRITIVPPPDNLGENNIDGSWKESYTADDSLQHLRDLVDRLNRITILPPPDNLGENNIGGSWKESYTTDDSLQRFRDLFDRLNRITIVPPPDIKVHPDINVPKINYRDRYDNLLENKSDKGGSSYVIILCVVIFIGFSVYACHYYCNDEGARLRNSGPSHNLLEFSNTVTDSNNISNVPDQPPNYDAVIVGFSSRSRKFPPVKPTELETPPPKYNDAIRERY